MFTAAKADFEPQIVRVLDPQAFERAGFDPKLGEERSDEVALRGTQALAPPPSEERRSLFRGGDGRGIRG